MRASRRRRRADGLATPSFLDAQLIGKFKLGNSVQALNNLADRFHCAEYGVSALT
jgi:hypothetical protein